MVNALTLLTRTVSYTVAYLTEWRTVHRIMSLLEEAEPLSPNNWLRPSPRTGEDTATTHSHAVLTAIMAAGDYSTINT